MLEFRKISNVEMYKLLKSENWFTLADNDTINDWLRYGSQKNNLTTDDIHYLALTVVNNSDLKGESTFLDLCYKINSICYTVFK